MKTKVLLNGLKEKTINELNIELSKTKKELFNLRFQLATNQLQNPMKVKEVKRQIAQINTIIKQKQLSIE